MGAGTWVGRASVGAAIGSLLVGVLIGCGDDGAPAADMTPQGECVSGSVFMCFDTIRLCSGRMVCRDGQRGPCMCQAEGPGDASMSEPDGAAPDASAKEDAGDTPDAAPPGDTEDCDNGRDDDGDGDIDCADADCTRSLCVPGAPDGFEGPFLTFIGGSDAPGCSGAYPGEGPSGGVGVVAPPASCSACSCASTSDACATYLDARAGGDASCGGGCSNTVSEACAAKPWPCLGGASTARVQATVPASAGACTPSAQDADVAPATFAQHARTCAPDRELARDGCGQSELCAPGTPFDGAYCVARSGAHDCPDGAYSERRVFYRDIADTRGCTECACERDCDYALALYPDADATCSGSPAATLAISGPTTAEATSACEAAPVGAGDTLRVSFSVTGSGACAASGGAATGSAEGSDPITLCCLPL